MGGKRKIEMKKREKKEQRTVTFSKRRQGLFKKAHDLHCRTGATTAVLAFSEAGRPYTHGDPFFDLTIERYLRITQEEENEEEIRIDPKEAELRDWLVNIQVDRCDDLDELVSLKDQLEEIRLNIIEGEFVRSFLA